MRHVTRPLLLSALLALTACNAREPAPLDGGGAGPETEEQTATEPTALDVEDSPPPVENTVPETSIHSLAYTTLDGKPSTLADFKGKAVLIVNTASACGYTPQYGGLEALHAELAPRGFTVLGFPSNDFGGQEPLDAEGIATFCSTKFGVTFPLTEKVGVKEGDGQSPVYAFLGKSTGSLPNWNFCKYVIDPDGNPKAFFPSKTTPDSAELRAAIEAVLPK